MIAFPYILRPQKNRVVKSLSRKADYYTHNSNQNQFNGSCAKLKTY